MNNYQSIATINGPEFINLEPLEINPMMSKCEIKVLYLGENRNGTSINKEAASQMAKTLRGAPIVGYYRQEKEDFFDHGEQIIYDGEGVHFNTLTKPYGFVSPDAKVWFQEFEEFDPSGESITRVYMMTTGYLWTGQFREAQQIFNEGGKGQSMELDENSLSGFWSKESNSDMEFFIINDAIFTKLCILGDDVEPCFEGSSITAPNISKTFSLDNDFKQSLFSMMKELQYALQGGKEKVEDEKKKSVDSTPVVVEETSTPVVEEPETEPSVNPDNTNENDVVNESTENTENEGVDNEGGESAAAAEGGESGGEAGSSEGGSSEYVKKEAEEDENEKEDSKTEEDDDEDKKKEDKYALLLTQFEELQATTVALQSQVAETTKELESLRQYKLDKENEQKDSLIAEFYMLSDEDKKDVIDHKAEYSLSEIKSKLAVLCYDKKVSFVQSDKAENEDITVNIDSYSANTPAWIEAVEKHRGQAK